MKVLVEFDPAYAGGPLEAVWIIDSSENRAWFKRQAEDIDPNSAIFNPDSEPLTILWDVFEHHPRWTEIVVRGVKLSPDLERGIAPEAVVIGQTADAFLLQRPH